jgi:hypothetical protein
VKIVRIIEALNQDGKRPGPLLAGAFEEGRWILHDKGATEGTCLVRVEANLWTTGKIAVKENEPPVSVRPERRV